MKIRSRAALAAAAMAVAALATTGIASASGSGSAEDAAEVETAISGDALEQASAAALAHLGEGTVTDTEVGDEESRYEVEVTRDDGSEVDVQLDEAFAVVGTEDERGDADDS